MHEVNDFTKVDGRKDLRAGASSNIERSPRFIGALPSMKDMHFPRCTLCQVQLDDSFQLAYHFASVEHLKKLSNFLLTVGFGGCCLVCDFSFQDPKTAVAHVEAAGHKHKVVQGLKATCKKKNFICSPCFLEFNDVVGWEVHLAICQHNVSELVLHLPKLNVLLGQLSGSSLDKLGPKLEPFCSLCEEQFDGLADIIFHFISAKHINLLEKSGCHVCGKEFQNIMELEKHLSTSVHWDNVNLHDKNSQQQNDCALQIKTGYTCHPCLVYCKSWQCFVLHLMDQGHLASITKRIKVGAHDKIPNEQNLNNCRQLLACSSPAIDEWNVWKERPVNLSAWCCHCSKVLESPEAIELHLSTICPHKTENLEVTPDPIASSLTEFGTNTSILHCEVCHVSFRSLISLSAHKAFEQHELRSKALLESSASTCLSDRGNNNSNNSAEILEASNAIGAPSLSTYLDTVHNSGDEIPLVVATAALPIQPVQASLHALIDVVLNTLKATLPAFTESTVSLPEKKRQKCESNGMECGIKKSKIDDIIQVAVKEGLNPCPDKNDMEKCSNACHASHGTSTAQLNKEGMIINSQSCHNLQNGSSVAIVVAAALIPHANKLHPAATSNFGDTSDNQVCRHDSGKLSVNDSPRKQVHTSGSTVKFCEMRHTSTSPPGSPINCAMSSAESDDDEGGLGALQARIYSELDLP